ncbi:MAG: fused response regulator/phosphatase [Gammaproteobacteria bacterium]|jgi:CheY-like chemotaxis protein/anti-sigma regulatory factor (Ser/Thr protein kinase)|nr:fused response regulator/phosphatase [Gammaproteobacteria bacterium]MBT3722398.1 fused response regulator/phosphatase [Gammaproteobacteria bacterium]MBT4075292.1 fused response regulator/phosphatase [Gammaproteobacteria bacterium]MBT4196206.1 fused response regulator/phosphatase [Gammaproteobacteria bacterium]MBT4861234.1 fused response regulator/phosphatase [Gammaproteobacteria bacterium]
MSTTSTPLKALIVDDEMTNRLILRSLLKKQGYETVEAKDGKEAVDLFVQESPSIVFMDVMMPVMDGYEATRIIKSKSGKSFIPIIFLTAVTDEESLQACIDAGGDDFLIKPYDKFLLQSKIQAMQRISNLNNEVKGMYSLIHREQEIAEQVFNNAEQKTNIINKNIRSIIRPATTFSGDMILSEYSPSRDIHFLIGDFTGHGLSSALGAMPVSEVFRAMTAKGFTPEEILVGINKKLRQFLPVGMFLCVQLISISHNLDQVTIFNAGMPEMLIIDGATSQIKHHVKSNILPLGVIDNLNAKESAQTLELQQNDKLFLYSDGLTEAWSESDEEFGTERLESAIQNADPNRIFDNLLSELEQFCGTRAQADDITLIEINCIPDLLPKLSVHDPVPKKEHHFESKGDWEYVFNLKNNRLRETNPVPIIINQIMEMEGIESERQSLFTVLTELFVNALDHGVLNLNSALKADPAGFALYFKEREERLNNLTTGHVIFHIAVEQNDDIRSIMVRIEDSGEGFDHENHIVPDLNNHTGLSGRGILLIRDLCESLNYMGKGNISEAIYSWKTT